MALVAGVVVSCHGIAVAHAPQTDTWTGTQGSWGTVKDWDKGLPDNTKKTTYNVVIDKLNSSVTIDKNKTYTIGGLKIAAKKNVDLILSDGASLTIDATAAGATKTIDNSGTIKLESMGRATGLNIMGAVS